MSSIFDTLPGLEVPVAAISRELARMWETTAAKGGAAPAAGDAKATQVNFVLHLGFNTTVEDAEAQFRVAVRFSQRAPCRVVVLCPLLENDPAKEMRAKIYGECHLGKTKGDTRCCEFVLLCYPFPARRFLEDQLSVCLVSDLPLYYWVHRFASLRRLSEYQHLLLRSERVLIDSAVAGPEYDGFAWPRPEVVRDLAFARLLPVRQSIGRLLAAYAPELLVEQLRSVRTEAAPELAAEGRALAAWARGRLGRCGAPADVGVDARVIDDAGPGSLHLDFEYTGGRCFQWHGDVLRRSACVAADFGHGRTAQHLAAGLLEPDAALSEAMFF